MGEYKTVLLFYPFGRPSAIKQLNETNLLLVVDKVLLLGGVAGVIDLITRQPRVQAFQEDFHENCVGLASKAAVFVVGANGFELTAEVGNVFGGDAGALANEVAKTSFHVIGHGVLRNRTNKETKRNNVGNIFSPGIRQQVRVGFAKECEKQRNGGFWCWTSEVS